ncbi:hypothetical protein KKD70_02430 [Patescibacteria group bacterium]|nr:hypothetical protein [Patescibacteria group bacterium]
MKKIVSTFVLISLITLNGCAQTYSSKLAVYDFDTAVVQYALNGATQGDETLYIRGDESAVYRFVTRGEQEENKLELYLGETKQIADMLKLTAVEVPNQDYIVMKDLDKDAQAAYLIRKTLGLDANAEIPASTISKEIAGQTCDIYEVANLGEACIWKGIVLEKTISMAGITDTKIATSIQLDVDIDGAKMQMPSNVVLAD